ncbi:retrovirus-related pol polyprotein from transposon TNT 1-94 [Tanacetum coccineum]
MTSIIQWMLDAQKMQERIRRLMYGSEKNKHVIHSQLMNEFDKFVAKERESLDSVYERLSTLVNVMDRNDVCPLKVSINTKFLNSLQPEWSKYVTLTRQNKDLSDVEYDLLYDTLLQFEPHVHVSKAKRVVKNHDPLAIIAYSSQSHASPSYSHSPQPYYVTHPSSVVDYEEDYQRELQGDAQEDKLTTSMMETNRNQAANAGNGPVQQNDESNQIVQRVPQTESNMLLAMKDEAGGTLNEEENDFMLDNAYGDETLEELTVDLAKKAFKARENSYLEDIVDLEEKLSSHGRIVYKIVGLGYQNPERLKKAIAAQPKIYDGERLQSTKLIIDSPDSEETLEDAEQTYFSTLSTFNVSSESSKEILDLPTPKMPNESKLVKQFDKMDKAILTLRSDIDDTILENQRRIYIDDESFNSVRRPESKDTKSKKRVLKNTNDKSMSTNVLKFSSCVSVCSNKRETMNSTVCQSNANVLKAKTTNVVNDGLNIVCVSCGKDVFMPSHKKCVAHYALTIDSRVKRALFTSLIAAKSRNLRATSLVVKSSGCSKHMTGNLQLLRNFVEKFIGTIRFGNDHFAAITGYGDYVQGNLTICHVYYVEGLGHNLFSVGQFCDGDLEVAFRSNTCYVWNLEGEDLLTSSGDSNLYTIFISKLVTSSPVCLMSKATSTKSWKWHQRLSHQNFACEQGKRKKASFPPKLVQSTESKLELIHMDLCGPMRVANKAPNMIINFITQIQRSLKAQVLKVRHDNGIEFKNEKLLMFYAKLGITHNTSTVRTPQQNSVVERRNHTLVEAARTMLIFLKTPEFLWAEAIATACFTQNHSLVHTRYNKTHYELIKGKKSNVQYFHVLGYLCYPTNNRDDLGKMKPKAYIGIFIGSSESSRGFRIYNRQTKMIMETIHVKFDELTAMASECNNSGPGFNCSNFQDSLEDSQYVPSKEDLYNLFGPLYEEYYAMRTLEVPNDSDANTLDNEDTPSSYSNVVEENKAP